MSQEFAEEHGLRRLPSSVGERALEALGGRRLDVAGRAELVMAVDDIPAAIVWPALVVRDMTRPHVLLGIDFLRHIQGVIDVPARRLSIRGRWTALAVLEAGNVSPFSQSSAAALHHHGQLTALVMEATPDGGTRLRPSAEENEIEESEINLLSDHALPTSDVRGPPIGPQDLRDHLARQGCPAEVICKIERALSLDLFGSPTASPAGTAVVTPHEIKTGDAAPCVAALRRVREDLVEKLREELEQMCRDGVIEKAKATSWVSALVLVLKPDKAFRLCVDFRALNAVTERDHYPLPRITDMLARLGKACIFSTMDLQSGYWQIPVHEEHRHKTAFITPFGVYNFKVLPFGLCNAPANFQREMNALLGDLSAFCMVYIDDIIIFSSSMEQHAEHLARVTERLRGSNWRVKLSKCHFAQSKVKFLGHVVSAAGVRPDPTKVGALRSYPPPSDLKGLQRFLGMIDFYHRFVPHFAHTAEPLYRLTRKGVPFVWDEPADRSFRDLIAAL